MLNLFIVVIFTFAFAMVLIYFISSHDRKRRQKALKEDASLSTERPSLDFRQFVKMCSELCENFKLEITDIQEVQGSEVIIRAISPHPITKVEYLIVGLYISHLDTVGHHKILAISDQIISERLSKAIVITTADFDPHIKSMPELAPMELIDGTRLMELAKEYTFKY
jgi:hypothetical protein